MAFHLVCPMIVRFRTVSELEMNLPEKRNYFSNKMANCEVGLYFMRFYFLYREEWRKKIVSKARVVTMYIVHAQWWRMENGFLPNGFIVE